MSAFNRPWIFSKRLNPPVRPVPQPPPLPVYVEPPLLEPDGLDRAAAWLGRQGWMLALGFVALLVTMLAAPTPQPTPFENQRPAGRPALGKIISLPPDLDPAPNSPSLPPPIMATPLPAHDGPRKAPHTLWTALIDSNDFEKQSHRRRHLTRWHGLGARRRITHFVGGG